MNNDNRPAKPARIYISPPHMSAQDRELLLEAFDSNWIAPMGPQVEAFEREFAEKIGVKHVVALSSGTAALHLAMMLLDLGPGDEVATATLTFAAAANVICYVGAAPVFIDSQKSSWNLDPDLLAEELDGAARRGRPIKAVLAVDVLGQCADYDPIRALCRWHEIPLVEDAAEALGATYCGRPAGTFGQIGCFSFNGNKIITTSSGGMLATASRTLADRARFLATQARGPLPYYEHAEIGYNYRMSNLLAALGRGQLRVLDERVRQRRRNFRFYRRALGDLPGIAFMPEYATGTIDPLADLYHGRPCAVRRHARRHTPGAGTREHRVAPRLEADAPATGLHRLPQPRGRRCPAAFRAGPVPSQRFQPERRRSDPDRPDHPRNGQTSAVDDSPRGLPNPSRGDGASPPPAASEYVTGALRPEMPITLCL